MSDANSGKTQPPNADKGSPLTGQGLRDATPPLPELSQPRSPFEPVTGFGTGTPPPTEVATGLGKPEKQP